MFRLEIIDIPFGPLENPTLFLAGEVASSMDLAWTLIAEDRLPVWSGTLAESQTSGRGRMGNVWQSPPGHIYAALRLPVTGPFQGPGAALTLAFFLGRALARQGCSLKIKWPNDLISETGKVGGILLENRSGSLVAGIGFNLGRPPQGFVRTPGAPPAAALNLVGTPQEIWPRLLRDLLPDCLAHEHLPAGEIMAEAEKSLLWLGQEVEVREPSAEPPGPARRPLRGRLVGLAPSGALRLDSPDAEFTIWSGRLYGPEALRSASETGKPNRL